MIENKTGSIEYIFVSSIMAVFFASFYWAGCLYSLGSAILLVWAIYISAFIVVVMIIVLGNGERKEDDYHIHEKKTWQKK